MTNHAIHKNLDTSFVNLSALIKYLRRRQFVGSIRVELTGYEADVALTANNELRVREHDRIAGRISEGEEALQRLLIRAREPGGNVDVFQEEEIALPLEEIVVPLKIKAPTVEEVAPLIEEVVPPTKEITSQLKEIVSQNKETVLSVEEIAFQNKEIVSPVEEIKLPTKETATEKIPLPAQVTPVETFIPKPASRNGHSQTMPTAAQTAPPVAEDRLSKRNGNLPPLPFDLTNKFEDKAKRTTLAAQDWQMLLNVTAELLGTVDSTLADANLEFAAAFEKARVEIAGDYPFLNPSAGIFSYKNGKINVREQIGTQLFAASINEALRRILEKLGRNPKFLNVYLTTVQKIILLIEKRRPLYDKFSITPRLAKIIGV